MILVYHEISNKIINNGNTVNFLVFIAQIVLLKIMGKKFVTLNNYVQKNKNLIVLRFDDVSKETLRCVIPILNFFKCPAEFFVVEDFVKSNNGYWADTEDLKNIVTYGHRIQYHSKSHKNLTQIDNLNELLDEILPPEFLINIDPKGMEYFAYPYWVYNEQIIKLVQKYYKAALSGNSACIGLYNKESSEYELDGIKMTNTKIII